MGRGTAGEVAAQARAVLHLSASGARVGGAEVQYEVLLGALHRQGRPVCAALPSRGDLSAALGREGIPTRILPLRRVRRVPVLPRRLAPEALVAFARECGVALVHCELKLAPHAFDLRRRLGARVVLHVRRSVRPKWMRLRPDRADAIVAVGERFRDELADLGVVPERVDIIRDATDLVRFRPLHGSENVLARDHPGAGPLRIGLVGRFEPFKRQVEAVERLGPLLRRRGDLSLFLVGDEDFSGPQYRAKVARGAAGLPAGRVVATGKRSDMPEVLNSLDLLVTLSGGSVMIEAMACGLPVVSMSDRPRDSLRIVRHGESGWIVPEGDFRGLEQALERLLDDAALRRCLGAAGRARAERLFGVERMLRETEAVYARVLGCAGARGAPIRCG